MDTDESLLLNNVLTYAKRNGRRVHSQERLGGGIDGSVWKSTIPSAIKAVRYLKIYQDERDSYLRLRKAGIHQLCGFAIPKLYGWDDALQVIEMSIVQSPYLLDFGKVYFDGPPIEIYDDRQLKLADIEAKKLFGQEWPTVLRVLRALREQVGIWYVDPKPANINLGYDDPDWDKETGVDYSEYEDEADRE